MSAAWRLSELGYPVTVFEKDSAVGGMGKTVRVGPYAVDFGPHTFHVRETQESRDIIEAIRPFFGKDPLILTRGTRVLLEGKYYVYPLELLEVLSGVSLRLSAPETSSRRSSAELRRPGRSLAPRPMSAPARARRSQP